MGQGREEDRGGVVEDVAGGGMEEDRGGVVEAVVGGRQGGGPWWGGGGCCISKLKTSNALLNIYRSHTLNLLQFMLPVYMDRYIN